MHSGDLDRIGLSTPEAQQAPQILKPLTRTNPRRHKQVAMSSEYEVLSSQTPLSCFKIACCGINSKIDR